MVTGKVPYSGMNPMQALLKIHKSDPPRLEGLKYSAEIKDFVKQCLAKDPAKRPTTSELLQHRFIKKAKMTAFLSELLDTSISRIYEEENI